MGKTANKVVINGRLYDFPGAEPLEEILEKMGATDISDVADGTVTGAITEHDKKISENGEIVELLSMSATRSITPNTNITLTDSMSNYKDLIFVYGSANNQTSKKVPVSVFKNISQTFTAGHYIVWNWDGYWYRFEYVSDTVIKFAGSANNNTCELGAIYGEK